MTTARPPRPVRERPPRPDARLGDLAFAASSEAQAVVDGGFRPLRRKVVGAAIFGGLAR